MEHRYDELHTLAEGAVAVRSQREEAHYCYTLVADKLVLGDKRGEGESPEALSGKHGSLETKAER